MLFRHRFALGLVLAFGASVGACGSCDKSSPDGKLDAAAAQVANAVDAIPAPDDLLGEATVLTPNVTWRRVQSGIGGAVGLMPQTLGSVVCSLAGIDLALGSEIDGTSPAYVTLGGEPNDPSWAIAVKVVEQRKARDLLLDSEGAKYVGKEDDGLLVLTPKGGGGGAGAGAVGLALDKSGFLIVAKDEATVRKLGLYAARGLSRKAPPKTAVHVDVTPKALSGKVRVLLEKRWQAYAVDLLADDAKMREARGGRAPDFGDPKAIVALVDGFVQRRLGTLASLTKLSLDLEVEADDLHLRADADGVVTDGGLAPMTVGAVAPILDVPKDAIAAIFTRSRPEERGADAKEAEAAMLAALGPRLPEAEATKLRAALEDFAKGRGDTLTLFALGGDDRAAKGLVLRTESKGLEGPRAISEVADLLKAPAFKEPLHIKSFHRSTGESQGVGKCELLDLTIEGRGKLAETKFGLAWASEGGLLTAALGDAPLELVSRGAKPSMKLSDDKILSSYIAALGKDASFVFFAQPFLVDQSKPVPPSPAVLAWGTSTESAGGRWLRLDVSDKVVRELLKKQLGL